MGRDVLGVEGNLAESEQEIDGNQVFLRALIRDLEHLQALKVVHWELNGQGRRVMVLVRKASEEKQIALMVLRSDCLYLGEAGGPFEAIKVRERQLVVHFLHAIQFGNGQMQQPSSHFHERLLNGRIAVEVILKARQ